MNKRVSERTEKTGKCKIIVDLPNASIMELVNNKMSMKIQKT